MLNGILAGLAAGALWGLVFVAPRITVGLSSLDLAAGRFVAYGLISLAVMLFIQKRRVWPTPAQAAGALALSVLGFTGYYWLLVLAIRDAGTEVPTLIIGTIPLWVMLLGKPAGLRWQALAPGLVLTALGLLLMMQAALSAAPAASPAVAQNTPCGTDLLHCLLKNIEQSASATFWRGVLWAVLAMLSWTAFALLNAAWLQRHPQVSATDWAHWLGLATGAGALALWAALGTPWPQLAAHPGFARNLAVCVATGIGSAWLATILWNVASQRLSPSLCGQLIVSETLFALLYSFAWDGRWPGALQALAAALFTLGIVFSIRAHGK